MARSMTSIVFWRLMKNFTHLFRVSPRSMPAPVSFVSSSIVFLQIQHFISHLVDYGD
jgi:hypothetical protein